MSLGLAWPSRLSAMAAPRHVGIDQKVAGAGRESVGEGERGGAVPRFGKLPRGAALGGSKGGRCPASASYPGERRWGVRRGAVTPSPARSVQHCVGGSPEAKIPAGNRLKSHRATRSAILAVRGERVPSSHDSGESRIEWREFRAEHQTVEPSADGARILNHPVPRATLGAAARRGAGSAARLPGAAPPRGRPGPSSSPPGPSASRPGSYRSD